MELMGGLRRGLSRSFERMSVRPLSITVFAGSVLVLVNLQSSQLGRFRARAVAQAQVVEHPARFESVVAKLHVRVGDHVEPGVPLAELSPYELPADCHDGALDRRVAPAAADTIVEGAYSARSTGALVRLTPRFRSRHEPCSALPRSISKL